MIGRSLVLRGELVMLPEGGGLIPASTFDIRGGPDDWAYNCHFAGPSRSVSRFLPAQSVLHFRINADPSRPWKGQAAHYSRDRDRRDGGERRGDRPRARRRSRSAG